jgi:diaminopimelate epimerase
MIIPFVKAHGGGNDFLLVRGVKLSDAGYAALARAICERHHGVGADGLVVFDGPASIRLFNADGSEAAISGNGTRCAAALLMEEGLAGESLDIETRAGVKRLRLLERDGRRFRLEMRMGRPVYSPDDLKREIETSLGKWQAAILDVGNPQCALLVDDLDFDWKALGREIESHPCFPHRTNVSFVRVLDRHTIEARFYERGAGPTLSSGTGSTGAAVAAILSGRAESPVRVLTQAGELDLEWREGEVLLRGPAEITARGEFYWHEER